MIDPIRVRARVAGSSDGMSTVTGHREGGRFSDAVKNPVFERADFVSVDFSGRTFESIRTQGGRFERCDFTGMRFATKWVTVLGLGEQTLFVECAFDNADLTKVDVPMLIIQGDDDQIVPLDDSGRLTAEIVKGAELKVYPGAPHGLFATHQEQFNGDLLAFIKR